MSDLGPRFGTSRSPRASHHRRAGKNLARVIVVVLGLVGAFHTSAGTVAAAYYKNCATTTASGHYVDWTFVDRYKSAPGISGAIADVDLRYVTPCTQYSGVGSVSLVPAVTIQYNQTDTHQIVQIGYGECSVTGGCGVSGGGIPNDGKLHFWYTASDLASGLIYLATWYGGTFRVGDQYRLKIFATTVSGVAKWEYCIRDKTLGEAYDCTTRDRNWATAYGTYAWWGTETHDTHDQNGNADSAADIDLRSQYLRSGTWYWTTQDTAFVNTQWIYPSDHYKYVVKSLYDADGNGHLDDQETLWSYTSSY